jgi:hypothetical protein
MIREDREANFGLGVAFSGIMLLTLILYIRDELVNREAEQPTGKKQGLIYSKEYFFALRALLGVVVCIYPLWFVITYYIPASESFCRASPRVELVLTSSFRSISLFYFSERFRAVTQSEKMKVFMKFFSPIIWCLYLIWACMHFDTFPVLSDSFCDFEVGASYAYYIPTNLFIFALIHLFLFINFLSLLRSITSSKQKSEAEKIKVAIFRTNVSFWIHTVSTINADLWYFFIYWVYSDKVFAEDAAGYYDGLLTFADFLFLLDSILVFVSVMMTYARCGEMFHSLLPSGIRDRLNKPNTQISTAVQH